MMKFVKNKKAYWEFIRALRNDKRVKDGFIRQEIIARDQHKIFMSQNGGNFYLCLVNGEPAGYVGVINDDIRVATHPDYQKMGVGLFMINHIAETFPGAIAKIKLENEASIKLFEMAGFKKKYYLLQR